MGYSSLGTGRKGGSFVVMLVVATVSLFVWSLSPAGTPTPDEQPAGKSAEQSRSSGQSSETSPAGDVQERAVPGIKVTPNNLAGSANLNAPPTPGTITSSSGQLSIQQQAANYIQKYLTPGAMKPVPKGLSFVAGIRDQLAQEAKLVASVRTTDPIPKQSSPILHDVIPSPSIVTVNGKRSGFRLSPNNTPIIVRGSSFGTNTGRLLMRGLPSGDIELTVFDWRDDEIFALVPATLRGVPDGTIAVVVIKGTRQAHLEGGFFFATREDQMINDESAIRRSFTLQGDPRAPAPIIGIEGHPARVERFYFHVDGDQSTLDLPCWSPGTDHMNTIDPGHGFVVTALSFAWLSDRSSSNDVDWDGKPGSHWFAPGYSLGDWTDTLPVNWGVSREHTTIYLGSGHSTCVTAYQITSMTVTGPAGVSPF
jgi:hypothetical protein